MLIIPRLTCGLGNRLFTLAAALGLADREKRKGVDAKVAFLLSKCHPTGHGDFENIFKLFPTIPLLESVEKGEEEQEVTYIEEKWEDCFTYRELPALEAGDTVVLGGCRQTEKYFASTPIQPAWPAELASRLDEKYGLGAASWFLHIRLGDYRQLAHHFIDLRPYYLRALALLPKGERVIWASDEPALVRSWLEDAGIEFGLNLVEIEETEELDVLYVLSHCRAGGICSNSTFSWWAAYFSHLRGGNGDNGGVWYVPNRWGNRGLPEARDIYSDWFTKLPC